MTKEITKMTTAEVEIKFKDVSLSFESYYKYTFNYTGQTEDGFIITASVGGDKGDIYRLQLGLTEAIGNNVHSKWGTLNISKRTDDGDQLVYQAWLDN